MRTLAHRSAGCGRSQSPTRSRHAVRRQRAEVPPERRARQRMQVVEGDDTIRGHIVVNGGEHKFRHDSSPRASQRRHHHPLDPVGNRISGENEHRSVTATGNGREPDLTSSHGLADRPTEPNQTSLQRDPIRPRRPVQPPQH